MAEHGGVSSPSPSSAFIPKFRMIRTLDVRDDKLSLSLPLSLSSCQEKSSKGRKYNDTEATNEHRPSEKSGKAETARIPRKTILSNFPSGIKLVLYRSICRCRCIGLAPRSRIPWHEQCGKNSWTSMTGRRSPGRWRVRDKTLELCARARALAFVSPREERVSIREKVRDIRQRRERVRTERVRTELSQ